MWALLAYYLRFQRQQHGLTGAELSQILGCAPSTTSRMENLEQKLSQKYAEKLDKVWRTGGLFSTLIHYARTASDPNWFKTYIEQEAEAPRSGSSAASSFPDCCRPWRTPAHCWRQDGSSTSNRP
jgi:transcriptional regulator with XRE-family HTH domain